MRKKIPSVRRQRGVVAILTGLMIAVLVGFLGLAVDLGRMFVIKSELQTSMDACALAAATQLHPTLQDATTLANAVALGRLMSDPDLTSEDATGSSLARPSGSVNRANFQDDIVDPDAIQITFSSTLDGNYVSADAATAVNAKYVRCTYPMDDIPVFFMRVLPSNVTSTTVAATAVATMTPAQNTCAIPVALCQVNPNALDDYGLRKGMWQRAVADNNATYGPGDFGWVNFPSSPSPPECSTGGGASYLGCLMKYGQCDLRTGEPVSEQDASGAKAALAPAWNSRFGYYGSGAKKDALPDRTGYAYTEDNWGEPYGAAGSGAASAAYDGISSKDPGLPNYKSAYGGFLGYQGDALAYSEHQTNPGKISTSPPAGEYLTTAELPSYQPRNRRLVITPVVDCGVWNAKGIPVIKDWACVLMLSPIGQADDSFLPKVEFVGMASKPGSPCSTIGLPGGSIGPLVPGLVQ